MQENQEQRSGGRGDDVMRVEHLEAEGQRWLSAAPLELFHRRDFFSATISDKFELAKILLLQHSQHFYLAVSVSIRDLHQKKFVQFLFRFLPR